jgi:hypothetical protein
MEKRKTYLKKVIKHWHINLVPTLSNYLNGKTRPRKQGTQGVLMNEMDTSIGGMDARYARMWTSNYFATFQNKGVLKLIQTQPDSKMEFLKTNNGISSSVNIQN